MRNGPFISAGGIHATSKPDMRAGNGVHLKESGNVWNVGPAGGQTPALHRRYTPEEDAEIKRRFVAGESWAQIGERMGRGMGSVRARGYALGLKRYKDGNKRKKNPSQRTIWNRTWQDKHPEKRKAHKAVERALASGRLLKLPCQVCKEPQSQAHHHDYSRPLAVTWLCQSCHSATHRMDRMAAE